jgi:pimeloyl-ACP methyl ester carboxylesterase
MSSQAGSERSWAYWVEPSRVAVDEVETAFRRKGSGAPTVFLHGAGLTRVWLPFLEELSASVDVIAPEHPGFGDSPLPDGFDGFDDVVLHYDAFLDALGLDRVHLVGHALGGWIAAELAVFFPRRFKSVTLIAPSGLRLRGVPSIDTFRMTPEELSAASFNGREERYRETLVQEGEPADMVRAFEEGVVRARLSWNPRYDWKLDRRLRRVSAPTLVIGAEEDRMVPTEMAARFGELIPNARVVTVAGERGEPSGHLVHVEQPVEVARLVSEHVIASEVAS